MPVKLYDVKGLMVEKKENTYKQDWNDEARSEKFGFNQALDLQGQVKIGLNRERLVRIINSVTYLSVGDCGILADRIKDSENELIERVE